MRSFVRRVKDDPNEVHKPTKVSKILNQRYTREPFHTLDVIKIILKLIIVLTLSQ